MLATTGNGHTILGIDPGTAIMGWGVVRQEGNRLRYVQHGAITTPSDWEMPRRLSRLFDGVTELVRGYRPETVAVEDVDLTAREAEQRIRRAQRGAEREELLAALEELAAWYRDLVVVAEGAESAVVHADRLAELREDAARVPLAGAARAAELARETWRAAEEFNVNASLALEALFVRLRNELAGAA